MLDLLSDVLATVRLNATGFLTCDFSAPWSIHMTEGFEEPFFISIAGNSVAGNGCWLTFEGNPPINMQQGDLLLSLRGGGYTVASDMNVPAVPWEEIYPPHRLPPNYSGMAAAPRKKLNYGGGGAVTTVIGSVFGFRNPRRNPLLAALPPYIYLSNRDSQTLPWLRSTVEILLGEESAPSPGEIAVAVRVAELLFINIIRAHLRLQPQKTTGWLRGLSDSRISRALAAIHQQPKGPWTVADLAEISTMSRAAFAKRFHDLTGKSPGEYLTEWQIYLAAGRFAEGGESVTTVAEDLGYQSVNAFTQAFKRYYGVTPGQYRQTIKMRDPITSVASPDA